MKYLKKFNESIKRKDIKEVIDEILDNLSSKKELKKNERPNRQSKEVETILE